MNKYEEMIIDIQTETKLFRDENKELKDNLAVVIAENNRSKEASNNGIASFRSEYIIVADKIFTNLRNQLFLVNQVRKNNRKFKLNFCSGSNFCSKLKNNISGERNV